MQKSQKIYSHTPYVKKILKVVRKMSKTKKKTIQEVGTSWQKKLKENFQDHGKQAPRWQLYSRPGKPRKLPRPHWQSSFKGNWESHESGNDYLLYFIVLQEALENFKSFRELTHRKVGKLNNVNYFRKIKSYRNQKQQE